MDWPPPSRRMSTTRREQNLALLGALASGAVIAVALVLTRWLSRYAWSASTRRPVLYVIGIMAAYWSWLRIAAMVNLV